MSLLSTLHISYVILVSLLFALSRSVFARNPYYVSLSLSRTERRRDSTVFTVNFKYISHIVLVFLLLILSMYLIVGFDISYFRQF